MKSTILLCLLALTTINNVICQKFTVDLTFTSEYNNQHLPIDSISIENLTQGADTMLYAPDTILSLECITGVIDKPIENSNFFILQNYPNPFKDKTSLKICMNVEDNIRISIRDIMGREVAHFSDRLSTGKHNFTFYPASEKYYLLFAETNDHYQTIKMVNLNHERRTTCTLEYDGLISGFEYFKSQVDSTCFGFNLGDQLRFIAFAKTSNTLSVSNIIIDSPITSQLYIFNFSEGIPCPNIPFVTYENQVYTTVLIGDQCWFNENLNIGTKIDGITIMTDNDIIEKYCYDDLESNCDQFGGLYQWNELMEYSTIEGSQGICPDGWHVATDMEWFEMANYLDPTVTNPYLQSWQGTDIGIQLLQGGTSGFEALLSGYRKWDSGEFNYLNEKGLYWTSTINPYNTVHSWYRLLEEDNPQIYKNGCDKSYGYAIRCIKDSTITNWSCGDPIIDDRDGQSYNTVEIDNHCWLAENINIGTKIDGITIMTDNDIIEKYCYDDLESNCDQFGGLYQWNELMEYSTIEGSQGICPDGWHVATDMEWFEMANYLDPTVTNPYLQSWQGTDIGIQLLQGGTSGFEALFSGYRNWDTGEFFTLNVRSYFWTSTINPYNTIHSWYRLLEDGNPQIYKNGSMKQYGFAVRCIKE